MTLYKDENLELWLDYIEEHPFLHVELKTLTKDMYKEYLVKFMKVLKENNLPLVYSTCSSKKARKLNEMFGFTYIATIDGNDVMEFRYEF